MAKFLNIRGEVLELDAFQTVEDIKFHYSEIYKIPTDTILVYQTGTKIESGKLSNATVHIVFRQKFQPDGIKKQPGTSLEGIYQELRAIRELMEQEIRRRNFIEEEEIRMRTEIMTRSGSSSSYGRSPEVGSQPIPIPKKQL